MINLTMILKSTKVEIKFEEIKKLLPLYECQIKIDSDKLFIKAILQRHVLETILSSPIIVFIQQERIIVSN
jgi:hypothetical protein